MYTPNTFRFRDNKEMVAFMQRYSFATIVTVGNGIPLATQLPFFIEEQSDRLVLRSHFAIANRQATYIEQNTSLVIFSEPHAYISPAHYDKRESVPTWDYIAVHAYGKARIIKDEGAIAEMLEQMILFYEKEYLEQWKTLSDQYRKGMIKGIVAFEMEVTDLQGQQKLSQNKTETERARIAGQLEKSDSTAEKDIASYIRQL